METNDIVLNKVPYAPSTIELMRKILDRHGDKVWETLCDTFLPGKKFHIPEAIKALKGSIRYGDDFKKYSDDSLRLFIKFTLKYVIAEGKITKNPQAFKDETGWMLL